MYNKMEKEIKIKIKEDLYIYGTLNTADKLSRKLVIFVHGFTGHANEHFLYNASRLFPQYGFDTFRFNLYWYEKDARKLTTVTVTDHVDDLKLVLDYFKKEYEQMYTIGHSLGGQVVVRAGGDNVTASVLWEPCRELFELNSDLEYVQALDTYIEHSNVDMLIGKNFVEDAKKLPSVTIEVKNFGKPLKIIGAEKACASIDKELYFAHAQEPKEYYVIKGSGHTFDEMGTEETLFRETLTWLQKF